MKKIKIGIIGVGGISNEHIKAYQCNPEVELYAFCDIDPVRLNMMGEKYGVERLFTDVNEMVALPELDAVSVTTWNSAHAPCTIAALNAGKHVLCEKPMSVKVEDAEAMKEAAEKAGKLLMLGFVCRHEQGTKILKKYIDNGRFGNVYFAKAVFLRRDGNPGGWFADKARSGGGPIIDLGVHFIDLIRYLAGNPKPVSVYAKTFSELDHYNGIVCQPKYPCSSARPDDVCDVEELGIAFIRFENGLVLSLETSYALHIKDNRYEVMLCGTQAGASLYPSLEIYSSTDGYGSNLSFDAPTGDDPDGFKNEINHFVDCIQGRSDCMAPAEDGVAIMKILNAIYESAEKGEEIML